MYEKIENTAGNFCQKLVPKMVKTVMLGLLIRNSATMHMTKMSNILQEMFKSGMNKTNQTSKNIVLQLQMIFKKGFETISQVEITFRSKLFLSSYIPF